MTSFLIKQAQLVDSGKIFYADILTKNDRIEKIASTISSPPANVTEINGEGKFLLPGVIDVHVHFREPGLTHKADIHTESRAAVAGGVTSFIEMPNTQPKTTTIDALEEKFRLASRKSLANFSFYMGATNDNWDELNRALEAGSPGIKVFLGASTGNMLVDNQKMLEQIFRDYPGLIMVHAEDEAIVNHNLSRAKAKYGLEIPYAMHADIRSAEACYKATSAAVSLARKYKSRLHIAHLSTSDEIELLENNSGLLTKKITSEVCTHHLWFDASDYTLQEGKIKCNPSIKEKSHKTALMAALMDDKIDIVSSDHAPHTLEEKMNPYTSCPSGIPLIQHSLLIMLDLWKSGQISLEKLVEKMCHNPAVTYKIHERGFLREGFKADMVLIDPTQSNTVSSSSILYKCAWSPFEGHRFMNKIDQTFVNGNLVYAREVISESGQGEKLRFS
ncbi:dihydroorotase [Bacteroidota bacterium]